MDGSERNAPGLVDTFSDTWVATDALGRRLPGLSEVGPPRRDKYVGLFYFLWLGQHGTKGPYDITEILKRYPDALSKAGSAGWGDYHQPHHWGKPLFDYYLSDDPYVIRKHGQMLADAGVDTIIFDVTNQQTYRSVYRTLLQEYTAMRRAGAKTPQVMFLTPFWDPSKVVNELYRDLYRPGLFSELWFRWKGKPLILADPRLVQADPTSLVDFFTFRTPQPDYFLGPTAPDQWGWLEVYPQHGFHSSDHPQRVEEVAVGVAQNAVNGQLGSLSQPGARGRSFHNEMQPSPPYPTEFGLNVQEQWDRALALDPEFILVTGWNEWIAGRFAEFAGYRAPNIFVDEFNQEFSRDIEPMEQGHGDNYYYQLVHYIRKFKGARSPLPVSKPKTIDLDAGFEQWTDVQPEFRDDQDDALCRDHAGWGKAGHLSNQRGRNDFVVLKVTHDETNVYFYARTKASVTDCTEKNWMLLFIRIGEGGSNWEGYQWVVNRRVKNGSVTLLEVCEGGWQWRWVSDLPYRVAGNQVALAVPRALLGLVGKNTAVDFEFKWADNIRDGSDAREFLINGDAAPNGRFNYRYHWPE